jgi:hypothetical protein
MGSPANWERALPGSFKGHGPYHVMVALAHVLGKSS